MAAPEQTWKFMQQHLGYTDAEMDLFRNNPKNAVVMEQGAALMQKTLVFEVVESCNCNTGHKVGDRIVFDGAGNLITKLNPARVCIYALSSVEKLIFAANELLYAGADPNAMCFKQTGCFDVGVRCGGWGHIVLELKVEDRA